MKCVIMKRFRIYPNCKCKNELENLYIRKSCVGINFVVAYLLVGSLLLFVVQVFLAFLLTNTSKRNYYFNGLQ